MLAKLYQWIYTRVGGQPWTHIVRDEQKSQPLIFLLIFLGLGIILAKFAGKNWWQLLIALLFGVVIGHLWW
uniref:Uncharacterized protein n=1 Tax=viral metagenome TaxID=1070528 RepID=A0A6M3M9Q7_9ZZZZ